MGHLSAVPDANRQRHPLEDLRALPIGECSGAVCEEIASYFIHKDGHMLLLCAAHAAAWDKELGL